METTGSTDLPWLPVGPDEIRRRRLKWYYFDSHPKIGFDYFSERVDFWDKIQDQIVPTQEDRDSRDEL